MLAFDFNADSFSRINHTNGEVEQLEWTDKTYVYGMKVSLSFDDVNHPFIYALGERAILKINIQTKEVSKVANVIGSGYGNSNTLELISDGNGSMFTAELHQGKWTVTKRTIKSISPQ